MIKKELLSRSPLKILEKTAHGGPGKGGLGAVVARKGVGKTAFLVHLATLHLLDEKSVMHVSFSAKTDHIVDWYEEIFNEVSRRVSLDDASEIHDEIARHRVIMNFSQTAISVDRIVSSLRAMIGQGRFCADLVVVDGYDFRDTDRGKVELFKSFARDMNLEIWFSVSVPVEESTEEMRLPGFFAPYADQFATIMGMRAAEGHVSLRLLKDHDADPVPDLHLILDPKTLLVQD